MSLITHRLDTFANGSVGLSTSLEWLTRVGSNRVITDHEFTGDPLVADLILLHESNKASHNIIRKERVIICEYNSLLRCIARICPASVCCDNLVEEALVTV